MKFLIIAVCLFGAASAAPFDPDFEGPWNSTPVDDPLVVELAAKGLDYNRYGNDYKFKKLIAIKEAKVQAAKPYGNNHQIKLLIGKTNCSKWQANAASCEVSPNAIPELCTYGFHVSPDLHWRSLSHVSCESAQ